MRVFVTKEETTGEALVEQLARARTDPAQALASIERISPHVDFSKIPAGTVLFLPDQAGFRANQGARVGGDAFTELRKEILKAIDDVDARVKAGHDQRQAQGKEMTAIIRSAPFRRALETDQELRAQAEAATNLFRNDAEEAERAAEALKTIKDQATEELAALAKLLD